MYPGVWLGVSSLTQAKPSDKNSAILVLANGPPRCHTGFSRELSDESSHDPTILIPCRSRSDEQ